VTTWSPQAMVYVKGGAAWMESEYDLRHTAFFFDQAAFPAAPIFDVKHKGWTVGVGAEWMMGPNWSAFVEFNYYDFRWETVTDFSFVALGGDAGTFNARPTVATATVGVNYRFNWGKAPVVARY
jgi:outer membrane immunogenic protein